MWRRSENNVRKKSQEVNVCISQREAVSAADRERRRTFGAGRSAARQRAPCLPTTKPTKNPTSVIPPSTPPKIGMF